MRLVKGGIIGFVAREDLQLGDVVEFRRASDRLELSEPTAYCKLVHLDHFYLYGRWWIYYGNGAAQPLHPHKKNNPFAKAADDELAKFPFFTAEQVQVLRVVPLDV